MEIAKIRATEEQRRQLRVATARDGNRSVAAWLLRLALIVARSGLRLEEVEARLMTGRGVGEG